MSDPAFPSPYTDPNITVRNPPHVDIADDPAKKKAHALTEVYDVADRQRSGFSHQDAPPNAPKGWAPGRDPYANGGAAGQTFLNNQA